MKNYDESLQVFREAFQLREREAQLAKKSDSAQEAQLKMAKIKHNIGCVNYELGNLEQAKASYDEAIQQQKSAFGTWTTPFMIMTDTTKPGFLTMASTMCNKGEQTLRRIEMPFYIALSLWLRNCDFRLY
jgi:tetratricopeptide (TPR) repeat protein